MGEFSLLSSPAVVVFVTFGKRTVIFLSEGRCEDGKRFLFSFSLSLPLCVGLSCVQGEEDGVLLRRLDTGPFYFLAGTVDSSASRSSESGKYILPLKCPLPNVICSG